MAKALKRTLKWAPKSPEMAHSIALDDLADAGVVQSYQSSADIAGLLGEPSPRSAAQEMMDREAAEDSPPKTEAGVSETRDRVDDERSPPPDREREKVPANRKREEPPQDGGVGW